MFDSTRAYGRSRADLERVLSRPLPNALLSYCSAFFSRLFTGTVKMEYTLPLDHCHCLINAAIENR